MMASCISRTLRNLISVKRIASRSPVARAHPRNSSSPGHASHDSSPSAVHASTPSSTPLRMPRAASSSPASASGMWSGPCISTPVRGACNGIRFTSVAPNQRRASASVGNARAGHAAEVGFAGVCGANSARRASEDTTQQTPAPEALGSAGEGQRATRITGLWSGVRSGAIARCGRAWMTSVGNYRAIEFRRPYGQTRSAARGRGRRRLGRHGLPAARALLHIGVIPVLARAVVPHCGLWRLRCR